MIRYGVIATTGAFCVLLWPEHTERVMTALVTYLEAAMRVL